MVDSRTKLHREIMEDIQKQLNGHVRIFDSYIPRSIDVSNAVRYGSGISELHKENKATIAYQSFVKELQSYGIWKNEENKRQQRLSVRGYAGPDGRFQIGPAYHSI